MRTILVLMLLLISLGAVACNLPASAPADDSSHEATLSHDDTWRRTRVGWERQTDWRRPLVTPDPAIGPLVVGLLQVFISVTALVAFPARPSSSGKRICQG